MLCYRNYSEILSKVMHLLIQRFQKTPLSDSVYSFQFRIKTSSKAGAVVEERCYSTLCNAPSSSHHSNNQEDANNLFGYKYPVSCAVV